MRGERAAPSAPVELEFWLKHCPHATAAFHEDLVERSTPGSPTYAEWLSVEEVRERLSPSAEALESVMAYAVEVLAERST